MEALPDCGPHGRPTGPILPWGAHHIARLFLCKCAAPTYSTPGRLSMRGAARLCTGKPPGGRGPHPRRAPGPAPRIRVNRRAGFPDSRSLRHQESGKRDWLLSQRAGRTPAPQPARLSQFPAPKALGIGKECPPASRSSQAGSRRSQPQSAGDGEKADSSHTGRAGSPGVVGKRARAAGCASSGRRCLAIPARRAFPIPTP